MSGCLEKILVGLSVLVVIALLALIVLLGVNIVEPKEITTCDGLIEAKEYHPPYVTVNNVMVFNGKTTTIIPQTIVHPERYEITVNGAGIDVPPYEYASLKIGQSVTYQTVRGKRTGIVEYHYIGTNEQ